MVNRGSQVSKWKLPLAGASWMYHALGKPIGLQAMLENMNVDPSQTPKKFQHWKAGVLGFLFANLKALNKPEQVVEGFIEGCFSGGMAKDFKCSPRFFSLPTWRPSRKKAWRICSSSDKPMSTLNSNCLKVVFIPLKWLHPRPSSANPPRPIARVPSCIL